jgi:hypothetical protein
MVSDRLVFFALEPLVRGQVFKVGKAMHDGGFAPPVWTMKVPGAKWSFEYHPEDDKLTLRLEHPAQPIEFEVRLEIGGHGNRRFFVCECCDQRRDRLVMDDGELICFEAHERDGVEGHGALRRARRVFANEEIRARGIVVEGRAVPQSAAAEAGRSMRAAPSSLGAKAASSVRAVVPDRYSTASAIKSGQANPRHGEIRMALVHPPGRWQAMQPQATFRAPTRPQPMDRFPILDVRILAPELLLKAPPLKAVTLLWGAQSTLSCEVLFVVDGRGDIPHMIAGHNFSTGEIVWQPLPLVRHPNGRFSFVCPVEKKNCYVLYLSNGFFASPTAHRLYHTSQRARGKKRHYHHDT